TRPPIRRAPPWFHREVRATGRRAERARRACVRRLVPARASECRGSWTLPRFFAGALQISTRGVAIERGRKRLESGHNSIRWKGLRAPQHFFHPHRGRFVVAFANVDQRAFEN